MNSYPFQPQVTEAMHSFNGFTPRVVHPEKLDGFKSVIESHVSMLTTEVQALKQHANWIEPRLHALIAFNKWMEQAHPDIIDAYKKSTAVAKALDKANSSDETTYAEASE